MKDLHDAILLGVHLDWATGTTTVTLRTSESGVFDITISNCTNVRLPRHEEWGRSGSVLSVAPLDGDLSNGLVLEMQSGDHLLIRGDGGMRTHTTKRSRDDA